MNCVYYVNIHCKIMQILEVFVLLQIVSNSTWPVGSSKAAMD